MGTVVLLGYRAAVGTRVAIGIGYRRPRPNGPSVYAPSLLPPHPPRVRRQQWATLHLMYKSSTVTRAHGCRRRNFKLEATLGSWVKHRMFTTRPNSSQP